MAKTSKSQWGFSVIEITAVVAIGIALAAVSMPAMLRIVGDLQLRSTADSFAALLQQARMRAVRDNKFYTVIPNNALSATYKDSCVDLNWDGACNAGEPLIQMPSNMAVASGGGTPSTLEITCGATSGAGPCPAGVTGLNFTPEPATVNPSFNARGLPCVGTPASTAPQYPAAGCFSTDLTPGTPNTGLNVGFLYMFQYTGVLGANYAAVAVTPAARVTVWIYRGKDAAGNDLWTR